jgi:hypothetical protein
MRVADGAQSSPLSCSVMSEIFGDLRVVGLAVPGDRVGLASTIWWLGWGVAWIELTRGGPSRMASWWGLMGLVVSGCGAGSVADG